MTEQDDIRRALAEYCHLLDDGQLDQWADLFTDNAAFNLFEERIESQATIRSYAHESLAPVAGRVRHLTFNSVIDVDGDRATATSDFVVLGRSRSGPVPRMAGRYVDRLAYDGSRWRFEERTVVVGEGWRVTT